MTELWLVRHGESLGNLDKTQGDTALSARGEEQARALIPLLANERFDLALSSPLVRAKQTASLAMPGVALQTHPDIRELVVPPETFIDIHGLGRAELERLLEEARQKQAGVESGKEFIVRVRGWLERLPTDRRVIAFTHFGVVRECLRQLRRGPAPQMIDHCEVHMLHLGD